MPIIQMNISREFTDGGESAGTNNLIGFPVIVNLCVKRKEDDIRQPSTVPLPLMTRGEHVVQDYISTGLSLKDHPIGLVRPALSRLRNVKISDLARYKDGDFVRLAGLITVRQRPGTAKGVLFMTLEDETGSANVVVWQQLFDEYRKEIVQSKLLMVAGKLQVANGVIHLVARQCFNLSVLLRSLTETDLPQTLARGNETAKPVNYDGRATPPVVSTEDAFHKGRNFH